MNTDVPAAGYCPASDAAPSDPNHLYKWSIVGMLWLVSFFNYADRNAISAVMPKLKIDYALTDTQLGLLSSSFLWVYAIAAVFAGYLGDRYQRKTVILGGLVVWSLLTFVTPFAATFGMFVLLRALTGLGEAGYYPAGTALISDYHGPKTRSRALSIHQTAVFVGGGIGTLFAAYLADQYHWKYAYFLYGALGIVLAVILGIFMRDPGHGTIRTRTKAPGGSFRVVLATPSAMMLCGVFFCATFVTSGITTWAPTFLDRELHLSLTQSTLYGASTVNAASLMGVLCSGGVADWAVARTKVARFYVLAIGLALASAALLPLGWLSTAGTIGLCFLGAGFFKGIFDGTIYAAMHDVVPPAARATAVGLMTTIGFAGAGLAPLLIGAASQSLRLGMALSLTAALYAIAAVVLVVFHRRAARDIAAVAA